MTESDKYGGTYYSDFSIIIHSHYDCPFSIICLHFQEIPSICQCITSLNGNNLSLQKITVTGPPSYYNQGFESTTNFPWEDITLPRRTFMALLAMDGNVELSMALGYRHLYSATGGYTLMSDMIADDKTILTDI